VKKEKKTEKGIFEQLYRYDSGSGSYIIEIALDDYGDIFSEWDPAPFKLRDIDSDLEFYLEGCSDDIPFSYPVTLSFTVPSDSKNEKIEDQARNGLQNGFRFKLYFIKQDMKVVNRRTLLFFLIGFVFLWAATVFPVQLLNSPFPSIIVEGFFIGGWVFVWEAISLILFTTRGLHHKYKTYRRLHRSKIIFTEQLQIY
jgi:hypothetical protein